MKNIFLFLALLTLAAGCMLRPERLRSGDLIFVGLPAGYSLETGSMDEAITASTGEKGQINLIHVAIVEVQGDSTWIIDATIRHGVDRHPLDTFLCDFTLKDGSLPVLSVKRLKGSYDVDAFVEQAKSFCGLPYDLAFLPDNGALYCTELVRESYRAADGSYLFENKPMNWKNAEGEYPLYWQQLFARLGSPIPQDVPGTNPQDMAASPRLKTVTVTLVK